MKISNKIIVFIVGVVWIVLLASGFITGLRKIIKPKPRQGNIDPRSLRVQQDELFQDVSEQHRRSIEENRNRADDFRRQREEQMLKMKEMQERAREKQGRF